VVFERFWLAFLPLFVAFDVIGLLPVYWTLAQGIPAHQRRQAVHNAIVIAFVVALAFLWVSGFVFGAMGIQMSDVMIAGGIILFVLALSDLVRPEKSQAAPATSESIGVVPLGVPLIVGPAVLTTILLVRQHYGLRPTLASLSLNVLLAWIALQAADWLMERVGREAARVVSKVFGLILAAFAVMLIRQGLQGIVPPH